MTTINPLSYLNKVILPKMDNDTSRVPLLLKDSMDNVGRTVMEYKRGGKDSHLAGQERAREEWATTVIWIFMRQALEKFMLNPLMKRVGGLDPDVDIKLLLHKVNPHQAVPQHILKNRSAYLAWAVGKFLIGTMVPVGLIGGVLPKVNQGITRQKKAAEVKAATFSQPTFQKTSPLLTHTPQTTQTSYGWYTPNPWGVPTPMSNAAQPMRFGFLPDAALSHAATFITNPFWGNVAIDLGISGGRIINARNPIDRMEYAGRELSIIAFLYWAGTAVKNQIRGIVDNHFDISTHLNYDTLSWLHTEKNALTSAAWKRDMALIEELKKGLKPDVSTPTWQGLFNKLASNLNGQTGQFKNKALALAHKQGAIETVLRNGKHVVDDRKLLDLGRVIEAAELLKPNALKNTQTFEKYLAKSRFWKHWAMAAGYIVSTSCTAILTPWALHQITKWRTGSTDFPGTMALKS